MPVKYPLELKQSPLNALSLSFVFNFYYYNSRDERLGLAASYNLNHHPIKSSHVLPPLKWSSTVVIKSGDWISHITPRHMRPWINKHSPTLKIFKEFHTINKVMIHLNNSAQLRALETNNTNMKLIQPNNSLTCWQVCDTCAPHGDFRCHCMLSCKHTSHFRYHDIMYLKIYFFDILNKLN